jgi:S1-C subfamily serine protease
MDQTSVSKRTLAFPLLAAAILGGAVSAGAVTLLDGGGGSGTTTTIVRQASLTPPASGDGGSDASDGGLTAADIYQRYAPGVAFVRAEIVQRSETPFDPYGPQEQRSEATGTGFVIDKSGDILTNNHVIDGASRVTVQFADKRAVSAKVIGTDPSTDIALLKVDPAKVKLDPLPLGSSKDVKVGDPTIAIGNPFGLDRTLTTGVVSALQRQIRAPNGFAINDVIQTDAAINPGNSGGPLINASGHVIGINSQIETGNTAAGGNVGIGFAVPIDTAKRILNDLKTTGKVQRAYLGVASTTVDGTLTSLNLPVAKGALVQTVEQGSPAQKAGIRGGRVSAQVQGQALRLGGDIITKIDGRAITSSDRLAQMVGDHKPGDVISVEFLRDGKRQSAQVKLAQRPNQQQTG